MTIETKKEQPMFNDSKMKLPENSKNTTTPQRLERMKKQAKKWLIIAGLMLLMSLAIIIMGVHIGANGEGKWHTESIVWLVNVFSSLSS